MDPERWNLLLLIRELRESDYDAIIPVLNEWWGGRQVREMLPRLFFTYFRDTSFSVEIDGAPIAFLCGFISQCCPHLAHIHFVGVHPSHRKKGLGSSLYCFFMGKVLERGCRKVVSVTSPVNKGSIDFHLKMGFRIEPGDALANGVSVSTDYDGPGLDRVVFSRSLVLCEKI